MAVTADASEESRQAWVVVWACFVALAVIRAFVAYVSRSGFAPFAWYRIVLGIFAVGWLTLR